MFRSNDDEFLLCYDGESFASDSRHRLLTVCCLQSLDYMSTSTVIPAANLEPLNGRELRNVSPCIIHMSYYSTLSLSRFGMWILGFLHRSSGAMTSAAYGTVVNLVHAQCQQAKMVRNCLFTVLWTLQTQSYNNRHLKLVHREQLLSTSLSSFRRFRFTFRGDANHPYTSVCDVQWTV
jgi:hypothetical protein